MRCQGYVRDGGVFTFGPVEWKICKKKGIVMIKTIQEGRETTLPACMDCWQRCIDSEKIEIIEVFPIKEEGDEQNG